MEAAIANIRKSEAEASIAAEIAMRETWAKELSEFEISSFGNTEGGIVTALWCYSNSGYRVEHKIPSDYVAFIGKMNYRPNVDAVLWYVEHIHSKLAERYPLVVIGAYPTNEIQQLGNKFPDIYVTGYMDDPSRS